MTLTVLQKIVFILQWAMPILLIIVLVAFGVLVCRFMTASRKRHASHLVIALALLAVCAIALTWAVPQEFVARKEKQRADAYAKSSFVNVGDLVPSFVIADTEGKAFSTDDLRGRVLLVNFFATWCGPCKRELPHLQEVYAEFSNNPDFEAIIVGHGETLEIVREFRDKNQTTMRMASDPDKTVFSKFASDTIPRTIVVAKDGTIVYSKAEYYDRDIPVIRKAIQRSL